MSRLGAYVAAVLAAGLVSGCGGDSDAPQSLPASLLGDYIDSLEGTAQWSFLPAGDPFCTDTVKTPEGCLRIFVDGAVSDYATAAVEGEELTVRFVYSTCGETTWTVKYTLTKQGVNLHRGICDHPKGPLVRQESSSFP